MKGLYFYKLSSPYQEDITKDCKLTINEIDHNFITLKNSDIKDIQFDSDNGVLKLIKMDGEELISNIDLSRFTKDFEIVWDKDSLSLVMKYDGKEFVFNEFISTMVEQSVTDVVSEIMKYTVTDNTIIGDGVSKSPLGINPLELTGTYKSVKRLIDTLPDKENVEKGDRYLTHEPVNIFGFLYNYQSVQKINEDLEGGWRVPSKEDWDDMLNSIELCDDDKNHSSKICNVNAGRLAGKLLKDNEYWKEVQITTENPGRDEPKENPKSSKGVNSYGFSVIPAGYGDGYSQMNYVGEQAEFWTLTETERTDVYTKRFYYNKPNIVQIAESPKYLCSIRLVKDYDGSNFYGVETINGINYKTVLMPSENTDKGYSIWTCENVSFSDKKYNPVEPNYENEIVVKNAYYINEWDGFQWRKKIVDNGDSFVIVKGPDGSENNEFRVVDNEIVNIKTEFKNVLVDVVESLTTENIIKEGEYASNISQENGVIKIETKPLVNIEDRILDYSNRGITSSIDLVEVKSVNDKDVKRSYQLLDKNNNAIGHQIIIDESKTNETYVSDAIQVIGGPLADFVQPYINEIKEGENIQTLLKELFFKEKYPQNTSFKQGEISSTINKPEFIVRGILEGDIIQNDIIVESGTNIKVSELICPKTECSVSDAIWEGFEYGYSSSNNNKVEGVNNPSNVAHSEPIPTSTYVLERVFVGFNQDTYIQQSNENLNNELVIVQEVSDLVVGDGENRITSYVTGATYSTDFNSETFKYYACSNLGNTSEDKYVEGFKHTAETENAPINSYAFNITGKRFSFVGAVENEIFEINSDNIRKLTPYAFNKEMTNEIKSEGGKNNVIIAFPKSWGVLDKVIDKNALYAEITNEFIQHECSVDGANFYTSELYYVYVYTPSITLNKIDYIIKIK